MLARQNITFVNLLPRKISGFCQHVKDDLGQKNLDVYNIPYNCLMKEHHWHIHLALPDQSAAAERRFSVERRLQLRETRFSPLPCYVDQNIREVTPDTVTRSMAWC